MESVSRGLFVAMTARNSLSISVLVRAAGLRRQTWVPACAGTTCWRGHDTRVTACAGTTCWRVHDTRGHRLRRKDVLACARQPGSPPAPEGRVGVCTTPGVTACAGRTGWRVHDTRDHRLRRKDVLACARHPGSPPAREGRVGASTSFPRRREPHFLCAESTLTSSTGPIMLPLCHPTPNSGQTFIRVHSRQRVLR
jgi:hypothetical protein